VRGPIIGITGDSEKGKDGRPYGKTILRREYTDRVRAAGGVPIILPPGTDPEDVAHLIDGWLIPGGDDLDPSLWGEEVHPEAELIDPERLALERGLFERISPDVPIFGICYGCQLLNVLHGGSLIQHLPDKLGHDGHRGDAWQTYAVEPGTKLAQIVGGAKAEGKSWHHQAISRLGEGLQVTARHEDGTIEGIESSTRPWMVGVQWHPERSEADASPRLFSAFVEQAKAFRETRTK
jgi:putative glutamine amidotransferase